MMKQSVASVVCPLMVAALIAGYLAMIVPSVGCHNSTITITLVYVVL